MPFLFGRAKNRYCILSSAELVFCEISEFRNVFLFVVELVVNPDKINDFCE